MAEETVFKALGIRGDERSQVFDIMHELPQGWDRWPIEEVKIAIPPSLVPNALKERRRRQNLRYSAASRARRAALYQKAVQLGCKSAPLPPKQSSKWSSHAQKRDAAFKAQHGLPSRWWAKNPAAVVAAVAKKRRLSPDEQAALAAALKRQRRRLQCRAAAERRRKRVKSLIEAARALGYVAA